MNYEAIYRTTPATPGLLKKKKNVFAPVDYELRLGSLDEPKYIESLGESPPPWDMNSKPI